MRTTISIDDHLLDDLKRRATASDTTVSRLIEDSIRLTLAPVSRSASPADDFELITFGRGGRFTSANMDKASALLEIDDLERFGRRSS